MVIVEEKKTYFRLLLSVSLETIVDFRALLFQHGLSIQEFMGFLFMVAQLSDSNVMNLIEMAKLQKVMNNDKVKNEKMSSKITSPNALYNVLEKKSPLKQH